MKLILILRKFSHFCYALLAQVFNFKIVSKSKYNDLLLFKNSSTGLYAIDKNPKEVDYDWILKNNFRIK